MVFDDMTGDQRGACDADDFLRVLDPVDQAVYERIRRHVEYVGGEEDCWVWCGAVVSGGYPVIRVGSRTDGTRRMEMVARWIYTFFYPRSSAHLDSLDIVHRCGNTRCVQPSHLAVSTHQRVMQRAALTRKARVVDKHKKIA